MSCGFNSTVPRRVMIGTGERAGPFYVTVDWPDGSTSTLTEVPANEALTVVQ